MLPSNLWTDLHVWESLLHEGGGVEQSEPEQADRFRFSPAQTRTPRPRDSLGDIKGYCVGNPNCNPPNSPLQTLESPVVCESLAELADIPQGWLVSSGRARGDPVAVPTAAFPDLASVPARFCSEDLRTETT